MNRGIPLVLITLTACSHAPDPGPLAIVDSLITTTEAANLTLNELDLQHYHKATAIWEKDSALFLQRFADTLDRSSAYTLAQQFNLLKEAGNMATDHAHVQAAAAEANQRLRALRNDLAANTLKEEEAERALQHEQRIAIEMNGLVHQVLDNYRTMQNTLANQTHVDSLLAAPKRTVQ